MPRLTVHARRALFQERQKQILDAAARVFAEKGFDRATIRDIARAAHVSEGSIYIYFKNKQDLLVHLPRQFMQPRMEAFQASAANADPSPDALLNFVAHNIVDVVTHNRELLRALLTSLPSMDEATRAEFMREVPLYAGGILEAFIAEQQADGRFRAELDPAITARVFPGMLMFFLLIQEIIQPPDMPRFDYKEVMPTVVEVFLRGVLNTRPTSGGTHADKQQPTPNNQ
jgi:AcrR family transcriptional regulator